MEGNKTVDELKPEVENVSNMGLNPLLMDATGLKILMKITTKHYDENSSAIDECLKELEKAMKSVRTKLDYVNLYKFNRMDGVSLLMK